MGRKHKKKIKGREKKNDQRQNKVKRNIVQTSIVFYLIFFILRFRLNLLRCTCLLASRGFVRRHTHAHTAREHNQIPRGNSENKKQAAPTWIDRTTHALCHRLPNLLNYSTQTTNRPYYSLTRTSTDSLITIV